MTHAPVQPAVQPQSAVDQARQQAEQEMVVGMWRLTSVAMGGLLARVAGEEAVQHPAAAAQPPPYSFAADRAVSDRSGEPLRVHVSGERSIQRSPPPQYAPAHRRPT